MRNHVIFTILGIALLLWIFGSWVWWFVLGMVVGWLIMVDEYEVYLERCEALRRKCEKEGLPFDPEASLGKRGDFYPGILVNGLFIGLLLCFIDRIFTVLFLL